MANLLGIVFFALGIGLTVALHEAGHMLSARAFGMRVRRYFIGFGPRVFSFRKGHTEYGLAAYVYSSDLARALRVGKGIESGMIAINRGLMSDPAAPFGGAKQSGLGREGGVTGILEFMEPKYFALTF